MTHSITLELVYDVDRGIGGITEPGKWAPGTLVLGLSAEKSLGCLSTYSM